MLCQVCSRLDICALFTGYSLEDGFVPLKDRPVFQHRKSTADFRASADEGCSLCSLVSQAPGLSEPRSNRNGRPEPLRLYPSYRGGPWHSLDVTKEDDCKPGRVIIAKFSLWTYYTTALPPGLEGSFKLLPHRSPASEACLAVAVQWMRQCRSQHRSCRNLWAPHPMPTRLLDVGTSPQSQIRLLHTNHRFGEWAALSYCWGTASTFVLTADTFGRLTQGIDYAVFPATYRDAIIVTRRLGLRYLWLDALCIFQDSSEDWAQESRRMKQVYTSSQVTILATNAAAASTGFLHDRLLEDGCSLQWKPADKSCEFPVVVRDSRLDFRPSSILESSCGQSASAPLRARGWAFQEYLPSPRTLSYRAQRMQWECSEIAQSEDGQSRRCERDKADETIYDPEALGFFDPSKFLIHHIFAHNENSLEPLGGLYIHGKQEVPLTSNLRFRTYVYNHWFKLVSQYVQRSITVPTDVLPALSGLAAAFGLWLGDEYHAGLWSGDILHGLMWKGEIRKGRITTTQNPPDHNPDWSALGAPSWSWASVYGLAVEYPQRFHPDQYDSARVQRRKTPLAPSDETGPSTGEPLEIEGSFCSIEAPFRAGAGSSFALTVVYQTECDGHREVFEWPVMAAEVQRQQRRAATQQYGLLVLAKMRAPGSSCCSWKRLMRSKAFTGVLDFYTTMSSATRSTAWPAWPATSTWTIFGLETSSRRLSVNRGRCAS